MRYAGEEGYPRWTWAWLSGDINRQQGRLPEAIVNLRSVLEDRTADMQQRGFDFSFDYEVINLLGQTLFDLGRLRARQGQADEARQAWREAVDSVSKNARDRFRKRDGASQSAAAVCRAGRRRAVRASMSGCTCVTSRTTTRKAGPNDWPASGIRPRITRPKPS